MSRHEVAVLALCVLGGSVQCRATGDGNHREDAVVVRVSATAGLGDLSTPSAQARGSKAAAMDLLYVPVLKYASIVAVDGPLVRLKLLDSVDLTADELAAHLNYEGLESATSVAADVVEVKFADAGLASRFQATARYTGVSMGPFVLESTSEDSVVLRRRGASAVDVIEILEVSKEDEWRLLLGRRVDIVPFAEETQRSAITEPDSIRVLEIPAAADWSLYFNLERAALREAVVRRAISHAIDRVALSRVVCGHERCAADSREQPAETSLDGRALSLLVIKGESGSHLGALVLRRQLRRVGVTLSIEELSMEEVLRRWAVGDYDLLLAPMPRGPSKYSAYSQMISYNAPEFAAAVQERDFAKADAILSRDAPATPLYEMKSFAAVDSRLCGDVTPSSSSWRWIADLRPCAEGERP